MKLKYTIVYIILTCCFTSCLTPIEDFKQTISKSFLTIEASLTDQPENNKVRIYRSSNLLISSFEKPVEFIPISKAKVYFTDEKGMNEELRELPNLLGTYQTSPQFIGRIGGTYILNIETIDGQKYQSLPETIKAVPEIESLITRFEINDNYSKKEPLRAGFNVYIDFQDANSNDDYYYWYWKHYEKIDICEICIGAPYDFRLNTCRRSSSEKIYNYKCDGNCWSINFSTDLNIFSDALLNGQRITGKQILRIPYDGNSPYYLQFEQRAITKNAFSYYQSLKNQTQNNGTLFDIPAETKFSFNIKSTTNPSEKILGIFDVYSFRKIITYIDRNQNVPKDEFPVISILDGEVFGQIPCVEGLNRTKIKPQGWKD
jgi:hypothetical protein